MKKYRITVNGVAYDVEVEEMAAASGEEVVTPAAPVAPVKKAAPKVAGKSGSVKITAPMPGKIIDTKKKPGDSVKKGDPIIILEAMKMENEICAGQDGVIASIEVAAGDSVENGEVLATMN